MRSSTQLITDLRTIASTEFAPESVENARNQLVAGTLHMLAANAFARATELKVVLEEMHQIIHPADPQRPVVNAILLVLV